MKHWYIIFAAFAVASAIPPLPTKTKNCIDHCKCKLSPLRSRLQVLGCDGPIILNETTFQYFNKPVINVISFENVIITQIQEDVFRDFKSLDDVLIINSRIGSIDSKVFNGVKRLKFTDCKFEDSPDLFSERLEEVHFGNCELEEIPKLNGLLSVTFLNLSDNYIKNVEIEAFAELFDLEELYLSDNEIFKLPATIFINNQELNSLYLDNNPLKQFYLNTSENLETLSLKNCMLETFDEKSIQKLSTLNELNLSNNNIKSLSSKSLAHMKELSIINLSYNKLEELGDDIFSENTKLTQITLDGNNFKTLPNFFLSDGSALATYIFSCKYCGLKTLPGTVFQYMPGISHLKLSHNKFMNVDNVFQKITSLKMLDIAYNNIAYISPTAFMNNKNLKILHIAGNPLATLNPEVFAFNHVLQNLDARNATLQKLWSNNNNPIKSLKMLLISDNQLTTLTKEDFKNMPKLEGIDLNNNPLIFTDKFCNVIDWLESSDISPIEYIKDVNPGLEKTFGENIYRYNFMSWIEFHNNRCPEITTEFIPTPETFDDDIETNTLYDDDEDEYNYDDEIEADEEALSKYVQDENNNLARASYILSVTSVFVLTALVVLTIAVTVTLCILKRNSNFNMHKANLPRLKIPLWNSTPGQKKHSGSVYRPLSEDRSGPKTPKLSRYEFTTSPTVHTSNP